MATARKRTTVSGKGRVPGSGKNIKGVREVSTSGKAAGYIGRGNSALYMGTEGPKKSSPRKAAAKKSAASSKGRVPGSGKNYAKGKGSIEYFPGGGKARIVGNRTKPKYKGVEGPKKSMPRKKK